MNLLNKLLEGTDPNAIKDYESYAQLHLKQIMTTINKHKLQDTIPIKIKKYQCYVNCYNYFGQDNQDESFYEKVEELRMCKEKCGKELKDVEKFLDNINFYSQQKFEGCSKSCKGSIEEKNICLWECYNRLDRRYKQYWANQRTGVQAKHTI